MFLFFFQDGNISTYLSKQEVLPLTCSYCQDIFTHETQEVSTPHIHFYYSVNRVISHEFYFLICYISYVRSPYCWTNCKGDLWTNEKMSLLIIGLNIWTLELRIRSISCWSDVNITISLFFSLTSNRFQQ